VAGLTELAARQYDQCRNSLQSELGVEPDPMTVQLANTIRHSLRGASPKTRQNAPQRTPVQDHEELNKDGAILVSCQPGAPPQRTEIAAGASKLLGRSDDNDVVLLSPRVSRYHARISSRNGDYEIEDLNSKNGTWVNGVRINGANRLHDGDSIQLGDVNINFKIPGMETMTMTDFNPQATASDSE
jgi:hypothetical protein